jgi:DNA-binding response OmpR family regulator
MLPATFMPRGAADVSYQATVVLLIEADLNARARHEEALRSAGFTVLALAACPDQHDINRASLVLSDVPSFHWLRAQGLSRMPPVIVFSGDEKAAVTACLCGAMDWVPVAGDDEYLLDVVRGVLRPSQVSAESAQPDSSTWPST